MLEEFLKELKEKYNYSDELMNAIRLSIPVMVDTYGEDSIEEILNLFNNVRIFATDDMSPENQDRIRNEMIQGRNNHIEEEKSDPYCSSTIPGSYYSYEAILDDNMNITEEVKWLVVDENKRNGEGYKQLFGTTINIPYFLHELNHAFAMQKPVYKMEKDTLYTKHGMFYDTSKIEGNKITPIDNNDIILEEAITELYTQKQLAKLLNLKDYNLVNSELKKINHIITSYSPVLIVLADKFEQLLGKDMLLDYRKNNNMSVKEYFNSVANKSSIKEVYFPDNDAWDYFSKKCFEIFNLSQNKMKYINDISEYGRIQKEMMLDAFAPIQAFREFKLGDTNLEHYEELRNQDLNTKTK